MGLRVKEVRNMYPAYILSKSLGDATYFKSVAVFDEETSRQLI